MGGVRRRTSGGGLGIYVVHAAFVFVCSYRFCLDSQKFEPRSHEGSTCTRDARLNFIVFVVLMKSQYFGDCHGTKISRDNGTGRDITLPIRLFSETSVPSLPTQLPSFPLHPFILGTTGFPVLPVFFFRGSLLSGPNRSVKHPTPSRILRHRYDCFLPYFTGRPVCFKSILCYALR